MMTKEDFKKVVKELQYRDIAFQKTMKNLHKALTRDLPTIRNVDDYLRWFITQSGLVVFPEDVKVRFK